MNPAIYLNDCKFSKSEKSVLDLYIAVCQRANKGDSDYKTQQWVPKFVWVQASEVISQAGWKKKGRKKENMGRKHTVFGA